MCAKRNQTVSADAVQTASSPRAGFSPHRRYGARTPPDTVDGVLARGFAEAAQWIVKDPADDRPVPCDLVVRATSILDLAQQSVGHLVGELRLSECNCAVLSSPRQFL